MPATDRRHYGGTYAVRAAQVRRAAYANSATTCWRCHLTLAESKLAHPHRRVVWHAGHVVDGDSSAPLMAECSVCNQRAGQALSVERKRSSGGTGRF